MENGEFMWKCNEVLINQIIWNTTDKKQKIIQC